MEILLINKIRGIAFILMFIYHIFVFLKFYSNYNFLNHYIVDLIGFISRNIFIIFVGISLYLSYINSNNLSKYKKKQVLRALQIYIIAIYITILTYYSVHEYYILFGVLHFISLSILILHNFINNFKVLFTIMIICILLSNLRLSSNIPFINYIYNILGFTFYKNTMDSFPIIKWLPKVIIGIFIGYIIHNYYIKDSKSKNIKKNKNIKKKYSLLDLIGKNTLLLYAIHFPIIIIVLKIILR